MTQNAPATAAPARAAAATPAPATARLLSVDAYRGLVMFLMMAEVLAIGAVVNNLPANALDLGFWQFLHGQQSHVAWTGCVLHDMIQPSFSLLVGVVLPFSIASRQARGQSAVWMSLHAFWRAMLLVFLGIFLRSVYYKHTNFTFDDTLTQIGLGYFLLFLLAFRPPRDQWIALVLILVGYWALFAFYSLPGADFDYKAAGVVVTADWPQAHGLTGFAAHWSMNTNPAAAFDRWFLNLFPDADFACALGGYTTLSFIPTLGTMILGLLAGGVLRGEQTAWAKARWLAVAGAVMLGGGWLLGWLGVCPVVKRIWTPSWVLFSGGIAYWMLAAFYAVIDIGQWRRWALPLVVIGSNSIAAYCMSDLLKGPISDSFDRHLGRNFFGHFGAYGPFARGASILAIFWLILFWLYRKRVFIKI